MEIENPRSHMTFKQVFFSHSFRFSGKKFFLITAKDFKNDLCHFYKQC